jgi:hypothetical protein
MNNRYRVERLPNGLIRVFDLASKLSACYHADGTYRHGDLRAVTLDELLATVGGRPVAEHDYLVLPHAHLEQQPIQEGIPL